MAYIENSLTNGEQIKHHFDLSVFNYTVFFWWFSLVFIITFLVFKYFDWEVFSMNFALVIIPLFVLPSPKMIHFSSIEMGVTNRRFIYKEGIGSIKTHEIRLEAIESIQITQDIWGKLFNYGNLYLTGRGSQKILLEKIDSPLEVKAAIEMASEEREKNLKGGKENV